MKRYLLNSKARNSLICSVSEKEYSNVHVFKGVKKMTNTPTVKYEGSTKVKETNSIFLPPNNMEANKNIQSMFNKFQVKLNELRCLGRYYDNYDHINKILPSLPSLWRLQVTAPKDDQEPGQSLLKSL
ncbi:hypothetical protein V8G54_030047 [Vigna mungo]|uniref:Uncharacterized protein n=1 Tax=Vigna mungo TaxID=3915 RepID=A0AAQ3MVL5_VIGMU